MTPSTPFSTHFSTPCSLGILGHPLKHTLSPALHAFFFSELNLTGTYTPYPTPPGALSDKIKTLQTQGIHGLNITIPHKQSVLNLVDTLSDEATAIGAVNTIHFKPDGTRYGHNTDLTGFMTSLPDTIQANLSRTHAIMLGAGGASRAIIWGLLQAHVPTLCIAARNPAKAERELNALIHQNNIRQTPKGKMNTQVEFTPLTDITQTILSGSKNPALIINTTPIGMTDNSTLLSTDVLNNLNTQNTPHYIYDIVYRPEETQLVRDAKTHGIAAQDGLNMLVLQGAASFELWTGHRISQSLAQRAAEHLRHS